MDSRYNAAVEALRGEEYPMLRDSVYLDHAGTTPYPKSLMDRFAQDMTAHLFGNPHSASASSQLSTARIDDVRLRVLQWFSADPAAWDVVFVANATAGIKLVAEALRSRPGGFRYAYHLASHTSLVGVREEAISSACFDDPTSVCPPERDGSTTLVAYPAQSNMDGQRFPLSWSSEIRHRWEKADDVYTLLDAASLVATAPLDLGDCESAPDFVVLSLYKIFGFPDLGALLVRRQAEPALESRRYFGGGTVDTVVASAARREQWHAPKSRFLHERLEDGTLPVHSIVALGAAMDVYRGLFGSVERVASHCAYLADCLFDGLRSMCHANGEAVCEMYSRASDCSYGPIIAFNIRTGLGAWVPAAEFEKLATLRNFHVRTGSVCNPGGVASALGLEPWEMKRNFSAGFRCGDDNDDIMAGKPTGVLRVSLGAMSTRSDVDRFVAFVEEFYREERHEDDVPQSPTPAPSADLFVRSITVYPIKSCGGYRVPPGVEWEVRPEGLAWDREWCLLHQGTGQALSQKRYPQMARIRPALDFGGGRLRVDFWEYKETMGRPFKSVSVPLSNDPTWMTPELHPHSSQRVCGDEISAQTYASREVTDFFSEALGVPCVLARFPPGGQGKSMRHAKAHLERQRTQMQMRTQETIFSRRMVPGSFPVPPSPPDSDSENARRRILLSNESPILLVNTASVASLNRDVAGAAEIPAAAFRANVVVGPASDPRTCLQEPPYAEDSWTGVRIGRQGFKVLGPCRRCHMVCVDQETGARGEEPFVTLSKTRRFGGRVFFGVHMAHCAPSPRLGPPTRDSQFPTIQVGDPLLPDTEDH